MNDDAPRHAASLVPVPKVAAAGGGGAIAVIVVWILSFWFDVPAEVGAAIAAIAAFAAGYIKSDQATR